MLNSGSERPHQERLKNSHNKTFSPTKWIWMDICFEKGLLTRLKHDRRIDSPNAAAAATAMSFGVCCTTSEMVWSFRRLAREGIKRQREREREKLPLYCCQTLQPLLL